MYWLGNCYELFVNSTMRRVFLSMVLHHGESCCSSDHLAQEKRCRLPCWQENSASPCSKSGRIAVKVINHLGDEVMKVFKV